MLLTKSKIFLVAAGFFAGGIFFASSLRLTEAGRSVWWLAGAVGSVIFLVIVIKIKIKNFPLWLAGLVLACFFVGGWRYSLSVPHDAVDKIWHYHGQEAVFVGVISAEPDIRATSQRLTIEIEEIILPQNLAVSGKVLAVADLYPVFHYGDRVQAVCYLERPEEFNDFAYDRYLARYGIYSLCSWPEIKFISSPTGSRIWGTKIFSIKDSLRGKIEGALDPDEADLLKALVLGDRKSLGGGWDEVFSHLGLSHIVAISGMNIAILIGLVMYFFLEIGLPRSKAFYFSTFFLVVYVILVGAPASAVRAGIMGFLFLLAIRLGRIKKTLNLLAAAAIAMLIANPLLLRDDIGFQLSFLAVWGMVIFYPPAKDYLEEKKILFPAWLRDLLLITFAAQILTWPVVAANFSGISLISPLSNVLVVWILPPLTVAGAAGLALSFVWPALSAVWFWPTKIALDYIFLVSGWLEKLPGGYKEIYYFPTMIIILYYFIIFLFLQSKSRS